MVLTLIKSHHPAHCRTGGLLRERDCWESGIKKMRLNRRRTAAIGRICIFDDATMAREHPAELFVIAQLRSDESTDIGVYIFYFHDKAFLIVP